MIKRESHPVVFSDGRRGRQYVEIDADGVVTLTALVVTRTSGGERCEVVYDRHPSVRDHVFPLSDLGNVTWTRVGPVAAREARPRRRRTTTPAPGEGATT